MPGKISNSQPNSKIDASAAGVSESFLARTLLAPLLFVSFLISLVWIDRQTSAEVFSHEDHHHLYNKSHAGAAPAAAAETKGSSKYYHSHQRHLAKRNMDDAFANQGKVIVILCVGSACLLAGGCWAAWRFWEWEMRGYSFFKLGGQEIA